jgi:hypothetical protein
MRTLLIGFVLVLSAACSKDSVCEQSAKVNGDACVPGINPDPNATSCKDDQGNLYICRGGLGFCVVCNGGNFSDGCTITNNGITSYCVHDCDHC